MQISRCANVQIKKTLWKSKAFFYLAILLEKVSSSGVENLTKINSTFNGSRLRSNLLCNKDLTMPKLLFRRYNFYKCLFRSVNEEPSF